MRKATCYCKLSIALDSELVFFFIFEFLFYEYHARCSADFRVCLLVEIFLIKSRLVDRDNLA